MRVTLQPSGAVLDILPGERILDGARRLGYECPQSCRNGNCHVCAALLVEGRVEQAGHVRDHGEFYTCIAEPLEDCIVLWDGVLALGELPVAGRPLLLGVSRKSFIGKILGTDDLDAREWPTVAITANAREQGVMLHRVHSVKPNMDALRMTEAILGARS